MLAEIAELSAIIDPKAQLLPLRDEGGLWRENLGNLCDGKIIISSFGFISN